MNFRNILKTLNAFFKENEIDHALIGGFALNAYGITRATIDLDILARSEDRPVIIEFLESLGYETFAMSDAFSQHEHPIPEMGRIDFLYVSGETAVTMLKESVSVTVFEDEKIKVVKPEHLVALKLYAISCNPDRYHREMDDIGNLLRLENIDLEEVKSYFMEYSSMEEFERLGHKRK
ncbi:nucleotidyl transferase AbiEii/AbiGii toxin family protein [bacterium]|nr:nucleotidyl transferase AbiEii/AbiGii toxin family protein [candidate division CSSED10-310 bacterium]